MKKKLPTLSIGIAAYNEQVNIALLLSDIKAQIFENSSLAKVIVVSDGSTDNTVKLVSQYKGLPIYLRASRKRSGLASSLNYILSHSASDIVVTLDADIRLPDTSFINKLVAPITTGKADYTSSGINEISPQSFFANCLALSMRVKRHVYQSIGNGHNLYTSFGLARAYGKDVSAKLRFPTSIGNDMYSYLYAISHGLKFVSVGDAHAMYKLPEKFSDSLTQSARFLQARSTMQDYFNSQLVNQSLHINSAAVRRGAMSSLSDLMMHPHHVAGYACYLVYAIYNSSRIKIQDQWPMATSTKYE